MLMDILSYAIPYPLRFAPVQVTASRLTVNAAKQVCLYNSSFIFTHLSIPQQGAHFITCIESYSSNVNAISPGSIDYIGTNSIFALSFCARRL